VILDGWVLRSGGGWARRLRRLPPHLLSVLEGSLAGAGETYPWVGAWLEAYWKERPMAFLFLRSTEERVGLAPLLDDRSGLTAPPSPSTPM